MIYIEVYALIIEIMTYCLGSKSHSHHPTVSQIVSSKHHHQIGSLDFSCITINARPMDMISYGFRS